jgi:hypothetical protein
MGRMALDIDHSREEGTHIVRMQLEPRTLDKHRAAHDLLMNAHHQKRFPGDLGLERMTLHAGRKTTQW